MFSQNQAPHSRPGTAAAGHVGAGTEGEKAVEEQHGEPVRGRGRADPSHHPITALLRVLPNSGEPWVWGALLALQPPWAAWARPLPGQSRDGKGPGRH